MESLNWKQSVYRDDSIKKTNIREYSPHTGTNLNDAYSDIHIENSKSRSVPIARR